MCPMLTGHIFFVWFRSGNYINGTEIVKDFGSYTRRIKG